MQYAVIVYETDRDLDQRSNPATAQQYMAAYIAYSKALSDAGIARGGAGLLPPSTATTVRLRDGKRHVQDGPFADTKERLGGFFLIEVPDLDTALAWAAKCPSASSGSVEVRPLLPPPPR
ncbi:MAG: YciI family protein [Phycisphaerales bacterium]|nr:YciI family protein [Phycisphaerales bacterium]